jgi:hypothetical protein
MNTPSTELIFPPRLIPTLRDIRDTHWAQLIDQINACDSYHIDRIAFELLVVRWCGCINCQADSFRAMQGCMQCAAQAVRRYKGSSSDLQTLFSETILEIQDHLGNTK